MSSRKKLELHGMSNTPEYQAWKCMKRRVNPNRKIFTTHRYIEKGITVCNEWEKSFLTFYKDMEAKPTPKHTLDRIDNDGNYEPPNCRWATQETQTRNSGISSKSKSGIRGVYWGVRDKKWRANIKVGGKNISLGYYQDIADAIKARQLGEVKYWGFGRGQKPKEQ